jgi:(4S)-4-hydroxy-5-phosphonooxypentane-2,3-dione isomerase
MFVVAATFEVKPSDERAFLRLAHEDAAKSLEREPGCRQFDVSTDPDAPGSVLFYEVYDSREAFEDHKKTEHFKVFDEGSRALVVRSEVRFLQRTHP